MQEIRLWTLENDSDGKPSANRVEPMISVIAEGELENLLIKSPDILIPHLKLVGRQLPTEGGFLDLLGIDEDGKLVVFELKRGSLTREAVAQIIDYASYLDSMEAEALAQHISERTGVGGIDKIKEFDSWYQEIFPNSPKGYTSKPRMVLVGLGANEQTERMVSYLAKSRVNISLITFYAFQKDGEVFLAKQVHVQAPEEEAGGQPRYTKSSNLEALRILADRCSVRPLLESVSAFFRNELTAYEWPSRSGYSYSLMERTEQGTPSYRAYISVYVNERKPKQLQLVFWKRAVDAAPDSFAELQSKLPVKFSEKSENLEIWIKSSTEWETVQESIKPVIAKIVDSWKTTFREESE